MKKCGIFAIAALMTILCGRLNAAVESDIVGYTTITLESGKWYQIGSPFVELDDATEVSVNTIFKGFGEGDKVLVYDPVKGYSAAYWRPTANGGAGGWCTTSGGPTRLTSLTLKKGGAVFINKASVGAIDISFAGKVSAEEISFGDEDGHSWSMITPVWPEAIELSELAFTNLANGDKVLIYTPGTGYSTGFWRSAANGGAGGWCTTSGGPMKTFNPTLNPAQALFINKDSVGVGTVSLK